MSSTQKSVLLLWLLALSTRYLSLGYPQTVVFDEVHWVRYLSSYFSGNYYFDVHPPLGKLIYAGWAYLWGFQLFPIELSAAYPDRWAFILRALPAFVGSLLPVIVYRFALIYGLPLSGAFLAGFFVAIDGALVDISRFVLLDPFLLTAGFAGLLAYGFWIRTDRVLWLLLAGLLGGVSLSIKWTGATFLAMMALCELWRVLTQRSKQRGFALARLFLCIGLIPASLYIIQFWLHFSLLDHSGSGDGFMTPAFQSTLKDSPFANSQDLIHPGFWEKFLELNRMMYLANVEMRTGHPYSSKWYTWPLMLRPIYMWQGAPLERIYLMGNPVIWWGSTIAAISLIQVTIYLGVRNIEKSMGWFMLGWLINLLPFMGIGRVMFLYHYFSALVFAVLMLAYWVGRWPKSHAIAFALGILALGAYGYFLPLTYGTSSDRPMFWLSAWR